MNHKKSLSKFTNTIGNWKKDESKNHPNNAFATRSNWNSGKTITLDQVFGHNFKVVDLPYNGLEGAEPPNFVYEYEINEADEDMYSELSSRFSKREKQIANLKNSDAQKEMNTQIKRKIIAKYSKNQKVNPQNNDVSTRSSDQSDPNSSSNQIKMALFDSPSHRSQQSLLNNLEKHNRKQQCNSQSPLKTYIDLTSISNKNTQLIQKKCDSNQFENHIAFRNSFYNYQKKNSFQQQISPKIKQYPNGYTSTKLIQHKDEIAELLKKESEKLNQYAARFNLNCNILNFIDLTSQLNNVLKTQFKK